MTEHEIQVTGYLLDNIFKLEERIQALEDITIKEMNKKEPCREKTGLEKEIEYVLSIIDELLR